MIHVYLGDWPHSFGGLQGNSLNVHPLGRGLRWRIWVLMHVEGVASMRGRTKSMIAMGFYCHKSCTHSMKNLCSALDVGSHGKSTCSRTISCPVFRNKRGGRQVLWLMFRSAFCFERFSAVLSDPNDCCYETRGTFHSRGLRWGIQGLRIIKFPHNTLWGVRCSPWVIIEPPSFIRSRARSTHRGVKENSLSPLGRQSEGHCVH